MITPNPLFKIPGIVMNTLTGEYPETVNNAQTTYSWVTYDPTVSSGNWALDSISIVPAQTATHDFVERISPQVLSNLEIASPFDLSLELTCTNAADVTITYALAQYNSEVIPDWVTLNPATLKISGTTPNVTTTTTYNFLVDASSTAWFGTKSKQITLVVNCFYTCTGTG